MVIKALKYALTKMNGSNRFKFMVSTSVALAYSMWAFKTGITFLKAIMFPVFSYGSAYYTMPLFSKMAVYYHRKKYEDGFP